MSTIPASQLVAVNPSVLGVGGNALDVIALLLTTSTRVPIGAVQSFPDAESVGDFFGPSSQEATWAGVYFQGFDGSAKKPGSMLAAQYNQSAVAAYLRGGDVSALTLAELKAISGSLNVVFDGNARNAASVDLSAATSFSSAATIIQTALNAAITTIASFTGAVGSDFTASIAGTTMTVTAVANGVISVGDAITGGTVDPGTTVTAFLSGTGGTGTYTVSVSQTEPSGALVASSNKLVVSAVSSGALAVGQTVDSSGANAVITAQDSGAVGGIGTYTINGAAQNINSESMTTEATPLVVTYDSISGAFVLTSGVTGVASTAAFATGTAAAPLELTSATGAVLSQGAAAAVPATFMNALVGVTTNWVTFATLFDPDGGSGNTVKQAFAAWKNTQNNRYAYACWDTDATPQTTVPASTSLGQILAANGDSGTCLLEGDPDAGWDATAGAQLAAFVCGAGASIDFTERNGRITFAYKSQAGFVATVTDAAVASNLGGNPQSSNRGNNYNFYGAYGSANNSFVWFQRGFVTGDFAWLDAYIDQVWLNASLQDALLVFLGNAKSVPYNAAGASLIEAALADPINAGLRFGAFAPGAISASQVAQVNADAGADVAGTLQTQGYYLQVGQADAATRAARASPPCKFWYLDRGSVQAITLNSIAVQ